MGTPPVVVSRWTELSELFVEFPPLVEGVTSRFAIHFTDLATFEPLRDGRAIVRLTGAGTEADEFASVDGPGRPGIFGVDVTPRRAGRFGLELVRDAPAVRDRHDLGEVIVLTPDEVEGLMSEMLFSESAPTAETRLSEWLKEKSEGLGARYASELARHYR